LRNILQKSFRFFQKGVDWDLRYLFIAFQIGEITMNMKKPQQAPANKAPEQKKPQAPAPVAPQKQKMPGK